MNSIFDDLRKKNQGSPMAAVILICGIAMLVMGIWCFGEDAYSSYVGFRMLEEAFGIKAASHDGTYWVFSFSFQVLTIIGMALYAANRKKYSKWLLVALAAQGIDVMADVWYRSQGNLFDNPGTFLVSIAFTVVFFAGGSEGMISLGFGVVYGLAEPGFRKIAEFIRNIFAGFGAGWDALAGGSNPKQQYNSKTKRPMPAFTPNANPPQYGKGGNKPPSPNKGKGQPFQFPQN